MNARVIVPIGDLIVQLRNGTAQSPVGGCQGCGDSLMDTAADMLDEARDWLEACLSLTEGGGPPNWDGIREFLNHRK